MVINKKILLYSLLAGSACIASHAWSMGTSSASNPNPSLRASANILLPHSSSSSSSHPPTIQEHRSQESLLPGGSQDRSTARLLRAMVGAPATPPEYHAPTAVHTHERTEDSNKEEEEGSSGLGRKRKRSDRG